MGIFITLFIIGLILSVVMISLSFVGDFDLFGAELDLDGDIDFDTDVGFSFMSPYMIAFLLMGIGMGGTYLEDYTDFNTPVVNIGSLVIGFIIALALQKMFRFYFVTSQANDLVRNKDFSGSIGVVTLRIPEDDIGEVAVLTKVGRIKMAARAKQYLPEGTKVKINEKLGNTLRVEPIEEVHDNRKSSKPNEEKVEDSGPSQREESTKESLKDEKSEFTFEAYRKKEEAKKPTVIYDQRNIIIKDSVINRSDFSELGNGTGKEKSPSELKKEMKQQIADELFSSDDKMEKE